MPRKLLNYLLSDSLECSSCKSFSIFPAWASSNHLSLSSPTSATLAYSLCTNNKTTLATREWCSQGSEASTLVILSLNPLTHVWDCDPMWDQVLCADFCWPKEKLSEMLLQLIYWCLKVAHALYARLTKLYHKESLFIKLNHTLNYPVGGITSFVYHSRKNWKRPSVIYL